MAQILMYEDKPFCSVVSGGGISFDNTGTDLTSTNIESAIKEVNTKTNTIDTNLNKLYDIEDDGELSDLNIDRVAGRVSMGSYNSSTLNIPVAGSGFVETFINKDNSNYGKQIAYTNNELYYRNLNSGTWSSWYKFFNNSTSFPNMFNTSVGRASINTNTVDIKINYWSAYVSYIGLLFTRYSARIIYISIDATPHATFTSTILHGTESITGTVDDTNHLVTLKSDQQWNAFGVLMFASSGNLDGAIVLQNQRLT